MRSSAVATNPNLLAAQTQLDPEYKYVVDKPRETPEPMTETDITNRLNPFCKYLDPSILDVVYINDYIKFEDLTMGYVYATIFLRGQ